MPRLSEKIQIANTEFDRRIKLTQEDKDLIISLWKEGEISQRKLAIRFGVNRRLIQFVLDPDKLKANLQRRAERGGSSQYYDRETHNLNVKEHREYKESLKKSGLIK